ncbi:hypothetical protein [Sinosporangium siamense]|uniref:Uncharacterized protein n=1 Tax=Sinosporangium siamense TaxID=1367973 RepID=A0A919REI3_9ACTN|nr:hypothetical protein [Sinosporangium siamense]GII92227.1 hypothetical protein Ssi02_24580 [Sinosporangium siamense]
MPSFGEVFFDARGQERVLRVTWHEGTLVLSLWRGEMCTASFRMPLEDVDRLLDTLDEGYAEVAGVPPEEEQGDDGYGDSGGGYPGTGQYVRPENLQVGHYDAETQVAPAVEERSAPTVGPNDVLVARGAPGQKDRLVASYAGQGGGDVVPRENMIVGDALPYGAGQGPGDSEPLYQMPGGPFRSPAANAPPRTDPHGFAAQPAAQPAHAAHGADATPGYGAQSHLDGPYGGQRPDGPEQYGMPPQQGGPDHYGGAQSDPYGARSAEPYPPRATFQEPADPFTGTTYGTPRGGDPAEHYGQQQHYGGDQASYGRRHRPEQGDSYGASQYSDGYGQQQGGNASDPYGVPGGAYPQGGQGGGQAYAGPLDPADPLGGPRGPGGPGAPGGQGYVPPGVDPQLSRPYVHDSMYTTGERMRPDGGYDEPGYGGDQHYDDQGYGRGQYDERGPEARGERGERRRRGERRDW